MPTLKELVETKQFAEEVDGTVQFIYYDSFGGMREDKAWRMMKLEEAGIDFFEAPGGQMVYVGPFTLRPRTDIARGCVPADLLKARACLNTEAGDDPCVSVYEAEQLWGPMLDLKYQGAIFDDNAGGMIPKHLGTVSVQRCPTRLRT